MPHLTFSPTAWVESINGFGKNEGRSLPVRVSLKAHVVSEFKRSTSKLLKERKLSGSSCFPWSMDAATSKNSVGKKRERSREIILEFRPLHACIGREWSMLRLTCKEIHCPSFFWFVLICSLFPVSSLFHFLSCLACGSRVGFFENDVWWERRDAEDDIPSDRLPVSARSQCASPLHHGPCPMLTSLDAVLSVSSSCTIQKGHVREWRLWGRRSEGKASILLVFSSLRLS